MFIYSFYQSFFCISYISYHPNMLKIMFLVLHITFFISLSVLLCILLYPHFLLLTVCIIVLRGINFITVHSSPSAFRFHKIYML